MNCPPLFWNTGGPENFDMPRRGALNGWTQDKIPEAFDFPISLLTLTRWDNW